MDHLTAYTIIVDGGMIIVFGGIALGAIIYFIMYIIDFIKVMIKDPNDPWVLNRFEMKAQAHRAEMAKNSNDDPENEEGGQWGPGDPSQYY